MPINNFTMHFQQHIAHKCLILVLQKVTKGFFLYRIKLLTFEPNPTHVPWLWPLSNFLFRYPMRGRSCRDGQQQPMRRGHRIRGGHRRSPHVGRRCDGRGGGKVLGSQQTAYSDLFSKVRLSIRKFLISYTDHACKYRLNLKITINVESLFIPSSVFWCHKNALYVQCK